MRLLTEAAGQVLTGDDGGGRACSGFSSAGVPAGAEPRRRERRGGIPPMSNVDADAEYPPRRGDVVLMWR